jgi:very-short-patch-repair endonuclease
VGVNPGDSSVARYRPPQGATRRSRRLRKEPTDAEKRMWRLPRECFPEAHFRNQVPIRNFIVDFVSHKLKLAIEVDGGQHGGASDEARPALVEGEGYHVLRFWNHDVLGNSDGVATLLASFCGESTPTLPSPIKGEGS